MKSSSRAASNSTKGKSKTKRFPLYFSISRVSRFLKKGNYSKRVAPQAPVYLAAVLQCMAAEVLELSGKEAKNEGRSRIGPRHIELAIRSDKELSKLLPHVTIPGSGSGKKIHFHEALLPKSAGKKNRDIGPSSK
ncbi:hypothetical protein SASPL_107218 [Salvia splendens]|uniref:Histone H2A n=1 Tax=Salvia splendens TaxID=180675 RepID=A0A8X8YD14_SALSN|nr:hypothetical protein SASPL_107218 [Salvia splendens]